MGAVCAPICSQFDSSGRLPHKALRPARTLLSYERMWMLFSVALGGALGASARYLVTGAMLRWLGDSFPYGTLAVNVAGSLVMGVLAGLAVRHAGFSAELRAFLLVGVLGGFTTFSAFSLDVIILMQRGASNLAVVYILGSVMVSVAALAAGLSLSRLGPS